MTKAPTTKVSPRDWPRLTRFYGITPVELASMPYVLIELYAENLLVLEAEETLLAMLVADMPHATAAERRKARRAFTRYLGDEPVQKIDHSTEAGHAQAAALGIKIDVPSPAIESTEENPSD